MTALGGDEGQQASITRLQRGLANRADFPADRLRKQSCREERARRNCIRGRRMQYPPAPSHVRRRGRPSAASARSVPRRPLAPGAALPLRSQPQRERLLAWSDARIVAGRGGYSAPGSSRHLTVPGRPRFGRTRRSACLSMRCRRRPPARSLPRRRPAHRSACPSVSSVATKRGAPVGPAARRTACRSCLIAVDFGTRMLTSSTRRLRAPASSSRAAGVISTPSTRWVQYRYWRPQPASPMRNSDTHEFWPDQKTHEFWPNGQDSCGCTDGAASFLDTGSGTVH